MRGNGLVDSMLLAEDRERLERRFWAKVNKDGPVIRTELGQCWVWTACISTKGYGHFRIGGKYGRVVEAHIVSDFLARGQMVGDLDRDHLCRNTTCVRPDHLERVTHAENMKRGCRATRNHCKRGHPYTPETLYMNRNGGRECRICIREGRARARARRAVA